MIRRIPGSPNIFSMITNNQPPCAVWKMWIGSEIEGYDDLGVRTLFVRSGPILDELDKRPDIKRVWLCKEFLNGHPMDYITVMCQKLKDRGIKICVEVSISMFGEYVYELRRLCTFYVKWDTDILQPGDHICIGNAFSDEAFKVGNGNKVSPQQYENDEFIA